jgi:cell division protein FtsB
MASAKARTRRPARARKHSLPQATHLRRWLAVGVIGLVAFLYYHPLTHYLHARGEVAKVQTQVGGLEAREARLQQRLAAQTSNEAIVREARRLGYVKPGERLFIVKGIPEWRQAHRSSIGGDG